MRQVSIRTRRTGSPSVGVVALVALVAFVGAGCASSSQSTSAPTTTAPLPGHDTVPAGTASSTTAPAVSCVRPHAAGQTSDSFTFQGVARTYQLYVPRKYTGTHNVPVVFDFHGFGSNAVQQMVYGNYKPEADRDNFLIVAPDGQVPDNRHFNLTSEKGLQNDVQMVGALLDHIEATFCVDRARVYATGMSDGGAMTSVLACTMSDRFAAFGAVAVIIACGGSRSVPIMAFSGTADPVVPFNGGKVSCCGGASLGSAPDAMARWAAHDHCAKAFTEVRLGTEVRRRTWTGCDPGSAAVLYIIDGGGHTWPGSIHVDRLGKTTDQVDASATIWRFFQAHRLAPTAS
ncbi:MAG: polyhydroxybutyrate depolymerase [Actinomycetota bacterium]|nr:polyhydroxybutyrate depolymerase [Actinomycetota bacterium]